MMPKTIKLGYTHVANISTIQQLLPLHKAGKIIPDNAWESSVPESKVAMMPLPATCNGIQSRIFDMQASFHIDYFHTVGWFTDLVVN